MIDSLIDTLLNQDEGVTLDFKEKQYEFHGATADKKSELLKDILSFANASRLTNAYILSGVREIKGHRAQVLGVSIHFDDAQLQQFVNSKLNRPLTFSYHTREFEGKMMDAIKIPIQNRPFYLRKKFGKLEANVVYIRRGTSTDVASCDEIASIGPSQTPRLIENRMRIYQEAYSHAEELRKVIHADESKKLNVIQRAQNWFDQNNLYLNPDIRLLFSEVIGDVGIYRIELDNYRSTGMEKGWNSQATIEEREALKAKFDKIQMMSKKIQDDLDVLQ